MTRTAIHSLALVACFALPFGAGCGDDCDEQSVDVFGMCSTDGRDFREADAIVGTLIHMAVEFGDNGTYDCSGGGTVTISGSGGCFPGGCDETHSYTFAACRTLHDTVNDLEILLASGSLQDHNTSVHGEGTTFIHDITGQVTFSGTVELKSETVDVEEDACDLAFTSTSRLLGGQVITGTICGREIEQPLYLLSFE